MFEPQFRHVVVGAETKFSMLHIVQEIIFIASNSLRNLSDK